MQFLSFLDQLDDLSESKPLPNKTIQITFEKPKIQYKYCILAFSNNIYLL